MKYKRHVFVCTNQRAEGARVCCGEAVGMELVRAFKQELKDRNLKSEIRAQRAGCMDTCEEGPSVVVYPEGVFYGKVGLGDVQEIVEEHLVNGRKVSRLEMKFDDPADENNKG